MLQRNFAAPSYMCSNSMRKYNKTSKLKKLHTCAYKVREYISSEFIDDDTILQHDCARHAPANAVVHTRDVIGAELHAAVDADPALVAVAHVVVVIGTALTVAVVTALLAEAEVNCNRDRGNLSSKACSFSGLSLTIVISHLLAPVVSPGLWHQLPT